MNMERSKAQLSSEVLDGRLVLPQAEWAMANLEKSAKELFGNVFETSEFSQGLEKAQAFLKCRPERRQLKRFKEGFAGFLFEQLAYQLTRRFLEERAESDTVVLSPGETFDLYQIVNPDRPVFSQNFGFNRRVEGLTIPDGIVFRRDGEETMVVSVCEYTLSTRIVGRMGYRKRNQSEHYETGRVVDIFLLGEADCQNALGKYLNNRYPGFFRRLSFDPEKFRVIYVRPKKATSRNFDNSSNPNRLLLRAPLTREEFRIALEGIVSDMRRSFSLKLEK